MEDGWTADLLNRWRQGDEDAAEELFRRYADRLVALARGRLSDRLARSVDPEDVVQSVYRSFFVGARAGRYELKRGGDLWRLLVGITLHKVCRQARRNSAGKRAIARQHNFGTEESLLGLQALSAPGPSPLEALALAEELEQALARLTPLHRQMVEMRLQGHTIEEIAGATQRSEQRVYRVLQKLKHDLRSAQQS